MRVAAGSDPHRAQTASARFDRCDLTDTRRGPEQLGYLLAERSSDRAVRHRAPDRTPRPRRTRCCGPERAGSRGPGLLRLSAGQVPARDSTTAAPRRQHTKGGNAMAYLKQHGTRCVPPWLPLPGQTKNSAGGHAWEVDLWGRLRRFLILGSEDGSYYASEWTLTRENAQAVQACIREDGLRAVSEIVRVSREGRAPTNDPALYALAMASGLGDVDVRRAALEALPEVARTGTHLFQFVLFAE